MHLPRPSLRPSLPWDNELTFKPRELVAFGVAGDIEPPGAPGYSTTNYIVLQLIAETLTGQPIQALIAERLTGPLGMPGTALPPNEDTTLPAPVSRGYLSATCVE